MTKQRLNLHEDLIRDEEVKGSSNRSFGLTFAAVFTLLAAAWLWHGRAYWPVPLAIAAMCAILALAAPRVLAPLNKVWLKVGLLLHGIVNPVVMGLMFYGAITPVGWLARRAGKDFLRLKFDPAAESYWIDRTPPGPAPETMRNQF